jgi:transcriptional regulator with XRE-family HTH domain
LYKAISQAFQFLLLSQRNRKNLSQYKYARKCGLSRQYVSLVEGGKRQPALNFISKIAYGFDMSFEDFMFLLIEKISYYKEL